MRILAGDIGGTNTRLSLFDCVENAAGTTPRPLGPPAKFKNAEFGGLHEIIEVFARSVGGMTDACFGVAGPVDGRTVQLTNVAHWPVVTADAVAIALGIEEAHRVNLINDMPAHAASLPAIERDFADHIVAINPGQTRPMGTKIIVMPGTGLGIGLLVYDELSGAYCPMPTEAGYADLNARDKAIGAIVASAQNIVGDEVVNREHLISGPGLRLIYACLKDPDRPDVAGAPPAETFAVAEATDPVAGRTLDIFTQLLAELCGNAAFEYLATGGIYLAGSIANSLRDRLASAAFRDPFARTGPQMMRGLVESIPVKLITFEETGLFGAAIYATWTAERRI